MPYQKAKNRAGNRMNLVFGKQSKAQQNSNQEEGASWRDLVRVTAGAALWTAGRCSRTYNSRKDGGKAS